MRKANVAIMTGLAFTLGIFLGLVIQLPVITFPSDELTFSLRDAPHLRQIRSVDGGDPQTARSRSRPLKSVNANLPRLNSLSALRPSLYGIVYPQNNGTNSYLAKRTQTNLNVRENYKDKSGTVKDNSKADVDVTDGESPVKQNNTRIAADHAALPKSVADIVNGVFWTDQIENECPKGFNKGVQDTWKKKVKSMKIVKIQEGCGRMQNRFITFRDTTHACARYRLNTDQIQGEIFSFYLAKLLGIDNVPPTSLHIINSESEQWNSVHSEIANSQWGDNKVVILTQYIPGLEPSYIPLEFRQNNRKLHPTPQSLEGTAKTDLCNLLQWSDLIIFDYLTANLDRVVNNMFNKQWNDQMMDSPAHNLETSKDGQLVFLDNESGLFHGYRLLDKYAGYHKRLLESLCVFRKRTSDAIEKLQKSGRIGEEVIRLFRENEEYHNFVPKIPKKHIDILKHRLDDVYNQIQYCRREFT